MNRICRLLRDEAGTTSIEYVAIASLVSIVIIGGAYVIAAGVVGLFEKVPSF